MNIWGNTQAEDSGLKWLVLDLNSFFASCEQQEQPPLRGKPVAVVPMLADTTCAIAASYEAKAFGVKTGTPVWEAKQRCPDLRLVQARPKLYVEYHHRILAAIETCIPIDDVMSVDEVACRLDRVQCAPEAARALALHMKATIRKNVGNCLTSSVGVAANKLLAKLASNMQKPDGLTILRTQDMPQAILHLPLDAMPGIGRNMMLRLQSAGIQTMDDLWTADAQHLRRVWNGVMGVRFHALLHGADLPSPRNPTRSIGHQHVLAPNERTLQAATPVIRQLLIRASQRLRTQQFYCRRLLLDIKWSQDLGHYIAEQDFQETQDTAMLLRVLAGLWQGAPKLKPLRVGIILADLVAQQNHQPDLFDRPKPVNLVKAVDVLNNKFGRGTITYGASLPEQTSKIAFQRVPGLDEF